MKHLLVAFVAFISLTACAQSRKSPHDTVSTKDLTLTYGRPYKKGRDIFGSLEKYGVVYRLGADEATIITFKHDAKFAGKPVKAGSYTMFVIPNETTWTFILNSQLGQWGAFKYEENKSKDVLHVDVPVKKLDTVVEQLTISFPGKVMRVEWDKTKVEVPLSF